MNKYVKNVNFLGQNLEFWNSVKQKKDFSVLHKKVCS